MRALGIPESQIGLIIGFFALSSMAVKPWAGLVAGALIFVGSALLYGWSRTAGALLLVRIFHGAGMGCYPTAGSANARMNPNSNRGRQA
jgi:hypothetical protein